MLKSLKITVLIPFLAMALFLAFAHSADAVNTAAINNDSKRVSDLSTVANALADFYQDHGIYPHVSGSSAESHWNELMTYLLRNGRNSRPYIRSTITDPLASSYGVSYNYKDITSGEYILAASLELSNDPVLYNDIDGIFGGINCNDATYCIGILRNYGSAQTPSQTSGQTSTGNTVSGTSTSTTTTRTSTRNFGSSQGLNINAMVANPLNSILGREIFDFGDYYASSPITTGSANTNTSANTGSNSGNSTGNGSGGGNGKQVAGASVAGAAGVATGTTDSLIISLLLSLTAAFIYVYYTETALFKKHEAWMLIRKQRLDKNKFNFA